MELSNVNKLMLHNLTHKEKKENLPIRDTILIPRKTIKPRMSNAIVPYTR